MISLHMFLVYMVFGLVRFIKLIRTYTNIYGCLHCFLSTLNFFLIKTIQ